jgi:site-specific recombinase XerD
LIRAAVADEGGIEVDTAGDALFIVFPSAASATLAAAAAQRALTEADWPAGDAVRVRMVHDLRHGFATALLRAGVNVKVVSEALGHSRSSFTLDVYAHILPGMCEQVASAIEAALAASSAASPRRTTPD